MDKHEIARRAREADEAAALAWAEEQNRQKEEAAAFLKEQEEKDGVWEAAKDLKRRTSGKCALAEALFVGFASAKLASEWGEPSPSVEQLEAIRKRKAEAKRRREEHRKFLQSLPPGERILHERIDALEEKLEDQDSRMDELMNEYESKISDLEHDMSALEN